jgi:hypothetical protein
MFLSQSLSTTAMDATCDLILKLHKNGKQNIDIFRTFSAAQEDNWKETHSDNQGGSKEGKEITEWCVKCKNSSMYHVHCFKLLLKLFETKVDKKFTASPRLRKLQKSKNVNSLSMTSFFPMKTIFAAEELQPTEKPGLL